MKDRDDVEAESLLSTGGNQDHQKQSPPNGRLCFALVVSQLLSTCALVSAST